MCSRFLKHIEHFMNIIITFVTPFETVFDVCLMREFCDVIRY